MTIGNTTLQPTQLQNILEKLEIVRRDYPMPFSVFASELLYELSAPTPDWRRIFSIQIDCFESSVAFFFFILLTEVEAQPTIQLKQCSSRVESLRKGSNLSIGHWWALLRDISKDVQAHRTSELTLAAKVALTLFTPDKRVLPTKLHQFTKRLDEVTSIRNQFHGHSFTLSPEQYQSLGCQMLQTTSMFFSVIRQFDDCTLFYVLSCSVTPEQSFLLDIFVLNGDMRRPLRRKVECNETVATGSLWICEEDDFEQLLVLGNCRKISPFIQFDPAKNTLLISQAVHKQQFHLSNIIGGEKVLDNASDVGLQRIDAILERIDKTNEAYQSLTSRSKEMANTLLNSPAARASYDEQSYLSRARLVQQLESVGQTSGAGRIRIWLASAPSGSGKTALACHAVSTWVNSGRFDEVTVVALSSEILSAQESICTWWSQRYGQTLQESCAVASQAGALIRFFVDGLDRLANPSRIVDDLVLLFQDPNVQNSLRVIMTSTEAVSNQINTQLQRNSLGDMVNRWSVPPLSPSEARDLFKRLHPESSDVQLGSEVETLLTSPLLVRLAQVLGEDESTVGITPGRLLRAHADRTVLVDPVRSHLALKIVEHILTLESKSIALELLLEDPSLRSVLLTSGTDAPLKQLIHQHVLLLDRSAQSRGLPLPSRTMISFAFDAQLDYLAFAQMAAQYGTSPQEWAKSLKGRAPFGPLIGGIRVFVVESLLDSTESSLQKDLAQLLYELGDTGIEVLKDLMTVGLAEGPLEGLLREFIQLDSPIRLAQISDESLHRLVIAGRADSSYALVKMLWRISPTPEFIPLCRYVIHITAWAVSIQSAKELAHHIEADSVDFPIDYRVLVLDSLREVHTLSGLREDQAQLKEIRTELQSLYEMNMCQLVDAQVILNLTMAQHHNFRVGDISSKDDPTVKQEKIDAGIQRDKYLNRAQSIAVGRPDLEMMVMADRALLYADKQLNLASRDIRQQACEKAVQFACSIGDPFAEALGCDVAAMAWHTNLGVQMDWIERGLIGASALNAQVARARLLDRRGRIFLSQGRLDESLTDAREATRLFSLVGHQRHELRTQQHLFALAMHETSKPGEAFAGWQTLIPLADRLGVEFQCRLIRLLYVSLLCDLGRIDEAQSVLNTVKDLCNQRRLKPKDVDVSLFEGHLAYRSNEIQGAIDHWSNAMEWAASIHFPDVYFQAFLQRVWAQILLYGSDEQNSEARRQVIQDVRSRLEEKSFAQHQARFSGELRLVLALSLLLEEWMEEANSRLQDAREWFKIHPNHPIQPELLVVELIFLQAGLLREYQSDPDNPHFEKRFNGMISKQVKRCRERVVMLGTTFVEESDQHLYSRHHRVEKLIDVFVLRELPKIG